MRSTAGHVMPRASCVALWRADERHRQSGRASMSRSCQRMNIGRCIVRLGGGGALEKRRLNGFNYDRFNYDALGIASMTNNRFNDDESVQ